jgi:hypothetical protein
MQLAGKPKTMLPTRTGAEQDLVYDLRDADRCSDGFYAEVSRFADQLLAEMDARAGEVLRAYGRYALSELHEAPRSAGEYAIEFLTLGMVLKLYAGAARSTPDWAMWMANELFRARRHSVRSKPIADFARKWVVRLYLMPGIGGKALRTYSIAVLPRLSFWLRATGEFGQEAQRLDGWRRFLGCLEPAVAQHWIDEAVSLFDWFECDAMAVLSPYTQGVEGFLTGEYAARNCREDQIFCGKPQVEYHLNMVAAEIMNRGLRADFERTSRRVFLVPGCMRGPYETFCRAEASGVDLECAACSPGCNVNRMTRHLKKRGAKIYLVPHATGFSRWLERWQNQKDTGVAAVACLLNILPGGYEMRARGIASQCMPLDYPGCQRHWRSEGIATSVDEGRLVQLVQLVNVKATPVH